MIAPFLFSQTDTILVQKLDSLLNYNETLEHKLDVLEKNIDGENMIFQACEKRFWLYQVHFPVNVFGAI